MTLQYTLGPPPPFILEVNVTKAGIQNQHSSCEEKLCERLPSFPVVTRIGSKGLES